MKVMLQGGAIAEYNDSYGARLIEQGKAVLAYDAPVKEETHADVLPPSAKYFLFSPRFMTPFFVRKSST